MASSRRELIRSFASTCLAGAAGSLVGAGCRDTRRDDIPGVVTLEFYNYATPEFLAIYNEKIIPRFEKQNPGIRIRMNASLGDAGYDAKLLTLIAGKMPPDLFHVTQQNFPFYAAKNILLPVDDFLKRDTELSPDAFYAQVTEGMKYKGSLLGLPSDFSTIVMLYNRDLFDRCGVRPPADDWTWDDYLDTARALTRDTDKDGHPDVYGTMISGTYNRWPSWVWMNGGDLFTPDLSRSRMDEPAAIEGITYYANLALKERVSPTAAQSMGQDFQDFFTSESTAMIADSRFAYKRFLRKRKLPFRWALAPMPRGKTRATTFIWGGNCILRSTRYPEESWKFLKFLSGPEGAEISREAGNALPAYRPAAEAEIKNPLDPTVPGTDYLFLDAVAYGRTAPFPPQYAEYSQAMSILDDAFLGLRPMDDACREFAAEVNGLLAAGVF